MNRVSANSVVEVKYGNDETIKVTTLTGGKMQKVLALQRANLEQFAAADGAIPDLTTILESLAICLDDQELAKDLWENKLTVDDAATIIGETIKASQASEGDKKKLG